MSAADLLSAGVWLLIVAGLLAPFCATPRVRRPWRKSKGWNR